MTVVSVFTLQIFAVVSVLAFALACPWSLVLDHRPFSTTNTYVVLDRTKRHLVLLDSDRPGGGQKNRTQRNHWVG